MRNYMKSMHIGSFIGSEEDTCHAKTTYKIICPCKKKKMLYM